MISLAERGINPFDLETVPKGFSGIYPEMSVSILFERMDGPIAQRAAKVVLGTLEYRQSLLENSVERETSGVGRSSTTPAATISSAGRPISGGPGCSNGASRSSTAEAARTSSWPSTAPTDKLDVLDGGGAMMAAGRILSSIESLSFVRRKPTRPLQIPMARSPRISRGPRKRFSTR